MTRWTPFTLFMVAHGYLTAAVIFVGIGTVQCASDWSRIRGTGTLQPTPHESSHRIEAVKPASRSHFEDCSPRVENAQAVSRDGQSGLAEVGSLQGSDNSTDGWGVCHFTPLYCRDQADDIRTPSPEHAYSSSVTGREWTPSRGTLRSDWDREPRLSKHGVRRVPARDVVLEVTETGRGPFLQAFRGGAAWKDTQPSVETRGARSNPQVINPSLVVNGKYASWPSLASVRGHVGEPTRAQSTITGIKPGHHLETLATAAAHLCGVPVRLFHSLIARESSWNPRARSSSGALGLGQLMPAAAKEMGVEDRLDPWQNALGAACFLRKQYDRAGSWREALLSYHAGPNRVRTSQASHDYAQDIIEGSAN